MHLFLRIHFPFFVLVIESPEILAEQVVIFLNLSCYVVNMTLLRSKKYKWKQYEIFQVTYF